MTDFDAFAAYRSMFAGPDDRWVCWWYFGGCHVTVAGQPELYVTSAETVMVYRQETIDADTFRIHWWEIGYFRDPTTGEIAQRWLNPVTGRTMDTPRLFEEGPAAITVHRAADGVRLDIDQPHAIVRGSDVTWRIDGDRVFFNQQERKARGLPRPDGTLPAEGSPDIAEGVTNLSIYAARTDVAASDSAYPCAGVYTFELDRLPGWMGFDDPAGRMIIRGRMEKTALDAQLNPIAWARLRSLVPHAFDGDRLKPRW